MMNLAFLLWHLGFERSSDTALHSLTPLILTYKLAIQTKVKPGCFNDEIQIKQWLQTILSCVKVNHKFVKTMEYMALHDKGKNWIFQVENFQQVNKIILWFDGVYTVCKYSFYGTLDINWLNTRYVHLSRYASEYCRNGLQCRFLQGQLDLGLHCKFRPSCLKMLVK